MEEKVGIDWLNVLTGAFIGATIVGLLLMYSPRPPWVGVSRENEVKLLIAFAGATAGAGLWSIASVVAQVIGKKWARFLFSVAGGIILEALTIFLYPSIIVPMDAVVIFLLLLCIFPLMIALFQFCFREVYEWD